MLDIKSEDDDGHGMSGRYWAELSTDGALRLCASQEAPAFTQLNLRARGGAAARALGSAQSGAGGEGQDGRFELLAGLKCVMCASTAKERKAWQEAIGRALGAVSPSPATSSC